MSEFQDAFVQAARLLGRADPELLEIIALSLRVSLTALVLACAVGLPMGAALGVFRFPGRRAAVTLLNALMGLPPVVLGLALYLVLSRSGPLGFLGLLFTPTAMILAQWLLVIPIVAALTRQVVEDLHEEWEEEFRSLGAGRLRSLFELLYEARFQLATATLAGFGRAIAEVGAVLIVGGNIAQVTRVMTTAIAMETNKGELSLALALGIVLVALSFLINAGLVAVQELGRVARG